jgi:hypothetical protein
MSLLRACVGAAWVRGAPGWVPALLLSAALGACSTTPASTQFASWYGVLTPGSMAVMTPALPVGPPVEVEGDGIEGQRPPLRHKADEPDDPSEPYSPNYGRVPPQPEPERAAT